MVSYILYSVLCLITSPLFANRIHRYSLYFSIYTDHFIAVLFSLHCIGITEFKQEYTRDKAAINNSIGNYEELHFIRYRSVEIAITLCKYIYGFPCIQ